MGEHRKKNIRSLIFVAVLMAPTSAIVLYAPTLYRMFCSLTGYGGTVRRAAAPKPVPGAKGKTVTVSFDANVAPGMPWEFRPGQRKVEARIGEPTKVYYVAKNDSDETIVGHATFNVTPYKAAPYFFKIQCFCFTDEKLAPGQSARMPIVFYVDKELLKDPDTKEVRDITLSYTFFRQSGLSRDDVTAARDLKTGSKEKDAALKRSKKVQFDNDAPRR